RARRGGRQKDASNSHRRRRERSAPHHRGQRSRHSGRDRRPPVSAVRHQPATGRKTQRNRTRFGDRTQHRRTASRQTFRGEIDAGRRGAGSDSAESATDARRNDPMTRLDPPALLLVEDDAAFRKVYGALLRENGYDVDEAGDRELAKSALAARP